MMNFQCFVFSSPVSEWLEAHQLSCLVKNTLGIPCPGCGLQTAVLFLLKGEWSVSVKAYPGLIPLLVFLLLTVGYFAGIKKITPGMLKYTGFICLIIILISYLLKIITH